MAPDGNSQAVAFVKRDNFNRPRFSVTEDYGFAVERRWPVAEKFCTFAAKSADPADALIGDHRTATFKVRPFMAVLCFRLGG